MKLVVVTHSTIAEGLKKAAEMIVGPQKNIFSINFYPDDGPEDLLKRITDTIGHDIEEEILFLTDIPGGTPANMCFMLTQNYKAEVITGVNLPMILELLTNTDLGLNDSIDLVVESGKSSIKHYRYEGADS
jgi:PTS system fructose IIA component.